MKEDRKFMERVSRDLEARRAACRILGVKETADREQLRKAYRREAVKYHPDHNGNTTDANRKFVLIKCAYELLAFDKPCDKILDEINSWPGMQRHSKYKTDNPWGHFLWWREKFFDSSNEQSNNRKCNSCI